MPTALVVAGKLSQRLKRWAKLRGPLRGLHYDGAGFRRKHEAMYQGTALAVP